MNLLTDARALVSGGAGFVGSAIVRRLLSLEADVSVVALPSSSIQPIRDLRSDVRLYQVDAADREAMWRVLEQERPSVVFNCVAGPHRPDSPASQVASLLSSVDAVACLLDAPAIRGGRCRVVHLGSSTEYRRSNRPLSEDDALEPATIRGVHKVQATRLCLERAAHGTDVVIVRPFSVYGPWEPADRLIPTAIRAASTGASMDLTGPGIRRDFVHVDDVAEICVLAAGKLASGTAVNAGTGQEYGNEEVVAMVGRLCGVVIPTRVGAFPARPADTTHWVADIERMSRLLPRPPISLEEGLRATLDWTEQQLGSGAGLRRT